MSSVSTLRHRRIRWYLTIGITILIPAILITIITVRYDWFGSPTVKVTHLPIGVNVDVTGGKVPKLLRATTVKIATLPVKSVTSLGPVVNIEPGGKLSAPMTMRFKLNHTIEPDATVFVASRNKSGDEWQFQQAKVSPDGRYALVVRTHLSLFWPFEIDVEGILQNVQRQMTDAITGDVTKEAEEPTCEDDEGARKDGYQIRHKGTAALYWCFGLESGERTLKITNRMRYPLNVEHPGFETRSAGAIQLQFKQLARVGSGKQTILFPFDTAVYTTKLKPGDDARIDTEYSGYAQSLHRFDIAVEALVAIRTKLSGKVTPKDWKLVDSVLGITNCYNAVASRDIGAAIVTCFGVDRLVTLFGLRGVLLSPFVTALSVANWLRGEFNSFVDILNGRSEYTVLVTRSFPADRFIGEWRVHGGKIVFRPDGTGYKTFNYGPGISFETGEKVMYTEKSDLKWRMNGDKLVYTITSFKVEDDFGRPPMDTGRDGEIVGESFTVTYIAPGLLKQTAHDERFQPSNSHLCGEGVSDANQRKCGA